MEGFQRLAAQGDFSREAAFFTKLGWTFSRFWSSIQGIGLPYATGEFYWQPSRVIPAINEPEPITEFPWFTTIYADLHAHFMSLALVFLAVAWVLAVVFSKAWQGQKPLAGGVELCICRGGDWCIAPDQYLGPADLPGAGCGGGDLCRFPLWGGESAR